jgi:hypothetical protein
MRGKTLVQKAVAVAVMASFMSVTSACFGPFNLTRNVYHFNSGIKGSGEVNEKWMKEIVFFGMIVIPVYMFAALLDAFIFNSIQFWTGDNPIKVTESPDGHIREVQIGEVTITVSWAEDRRSADLTYWQQGRFITTAKIMEDDQGFRLLDRENRLRYTTERSHDGGVNFVDHDCRLVDRLSLHQLQAGAKKLEEQLS